MRPRYLVLANPGSLRRQAYETDLRNYWQQRGIDPLIEFVAWRDVIATAGNLVSFPVFDEPGIVRLESPGRDWDVARMLLHLGRNETGPFVDYLSLEYRKGWLIHPAAFYRGFCRVLQGLHHSFATRPYLHLTAHPLEVAEMFDKNATCRRLNEAGIPIPETIDLPGTAAVLLDDLRHRRFHTAYVKLNTGSSASAIAVVRPLEPTPHAVSSMAFLDGEFFSTRRLVNYRGERLEAALTFLLREGACVQRGIRMAQIEGQNFDVRVIVLRGKPAFTIFRLSNQPMTNLHLGGRRGESAECRARIPTRAWLDAMDHCVETASLYRSDMVGIDLLFECGYFRHYILEVNAFGDFFPNLKDEQGRSVHQAEIEATGKFAK